MISVIIDTYNGYQNWNSGYSNYKTQPFVKHLEEKLKSNSLSTEERARISEQIARIEKIGKSNSQWNDGTILMINITNLVGSMLGPVGAGITKYSTHNLESKVRSEEGLKIGRVRKIGGMRIASKCKRGENPNARVSVQPNMKSVKATALDAIKDFVWDLLTPDLGALSSRILTVIRFFVPI